MYATSFPHFHFASVEPSAGLVSPPVVDVLSFVVSVVLLASVGAGSLGVVSSVLGVTFESVVGVVVSAGFVGTFYLSRPSI